MTRPTTYYRPLALDDALALAASPGAVAPAGGALLFGALDLTFDSVVDLQGIAELRRIASDGQGVTLGAAVTLQEVVESDGVPSFFKRALTRALPLNLRNGASVGESLLAPQPPREWLAALVAHDAGVMRALPDGRRLIDGLAGLMDGSAPAALHDGILTGVFIPRPHEREALGAAFVARTPADEAIVNAAVHVQLRPDRRVDTAFAALCGASVAPVVTIYLSTLAGNPLDEATIAGAVELVAAAVEPPGDFLGSADYRREMARVVVERALLDARTALA